MREKTRRWVRETRQKEEILEVLKRPDLLLLAFKMEEGRLQMKE